jgi:hypothetical protein
MRFGESGKNGFPHRSEQEMIVVSPQDIPAADTVKRDCMLAPIIQNRAVHPVHENK